MKRLWALMVLSVAATFIVAACGGGRATSTPTSTPGGGVSTPVVESTPTQEPTPSPEPVPTATPTPPQETPGGSSAPASRYSWEVSTIDDNGAKPSLAVDPQGTPHIAYMLEAMPGFVKHAVHDSNGDWNISTVSTGYFYGPLDIVVDEGGVPQISWHNHDKENGAYAALVNGKWVVHDINHPGHDGWDINLSIDSSGRPHIISINPSQFGSQSGVEYATFDGEVWQVEEVGSGPVPYEFGTGIALDSQDRVHVVWLDNSTKDLKYAITDGDSWDISTVDSEGDVGRFPSLALDKQGNPAISYYERMSAARDISSLPAGTAVSGIPSASTSLRRCSSATSGRGRIALWS